jgi:hypothetical protein
MGAAPFPPLAGAVPRPQVRVTTPPRPTGGPLFAANPRCRSPWPGRPGTAIGGALPTERWRPGTGRIRPRVLLQVPCHIPSRPSTLDVPRLSSDLVEPFSIIVGESSHALRLAIGGVQNASPCRQFRQHGGFHLAAIPRSVRGPLRRKLAQSSRLGGATTVLVACRRPHKSRMRASRHGTPVPLRI